MSNAVEYALVGSVVTGLLLAGAVVAETRTGVMDDLVQIIRSVDLDRQTPPAEP